MNSGKRFNGQWLWKDADVDQRPPEELGWEQVSSDAALMEFGSA